MEGLEEMICFRTPPHAPSACSVLTPILVLRTKPNVTITPGLAASFTIANPAFACQSHHPPTFD
ncbi:hypothetical protein ACLOJK_015273 [Asimina triloba]